MNKLYQSELYTKHHWSIVGSILFVLIFVGWEFKGIIFLPSVVFLVLAGILFAGQIAVIKICEEDAEKRKKEYIDGIKWLALPAWLIVIDIYIAWIYG